MTAAEIIAILPLIAVTTAAIVVMLQIAWRRRHGVAAALTAAGLAVSLASLGPAAAVAPRSATPLISIDGYALFYMGLFFAAALAVAGLAHGYFGRRHDRAEEFYLLILIATLGASVLAGASHFASLVLGFEILSVALFALVAYPLAHERPLEAAVKYLVLAGVSSAFLFFGLALVYAASGTLAFAALGQMGIAADGSAKGAYVLVGFALAFVGIGFKLSLVPFHMWAPDVYEGAPAPATAYLATVSKGAVFVLLLRFFAEAGGYMAWSITLVVGLVAAASMLAGNLLALLQRNVKRILAYSSIAHFGYLLVSFLAAGPMAAEAVGYYIAAYFVTTLGAFGVVSVASERHDAGSEMETLEDYRGLFRRYPWLAGAFTAMLLSLAGIPLTMGFIAKFYVIAAGAGASLWLLVIILIVGSAIGLFYYLRIIFLLFAEGGAAAPRASSTLSREGRMTLAALTGLLVVLGVYPGPLIEVIRVATAGLQ